MTQAEKIATILQVLEKLENAILANDRTQQTRLALEAREIRKSIA